ncbi:hypothetical protein ACIQM0_01420 [Streptomyces sp. NPDC091387]|uniref:hypothetical protein n=1 Tax=Streptomyces sp. NPDC091387 TaxID=3365998 RepID=UPI003822D1DF
MTARKPNAAAGAAHERLFPGHVSNEVLTDRGVELPLEGRSTTGPDTRMEQGLAVHWMWSMLPLTAARRVLASWSCPRSATSESDVRCG